MPRLRFTDNIQRHVACPAATVDGATLRAALDAYFAGNPRARTYVLDEQGAIRKHMTIFVNGRPIADRTNLTDPLSADTEIYIMQALSGG